MGFCNSLGSDDNDGHATLAGASQEQGATHLAQHTQTLQYYLYIGVSATAIIRISANKHQSTVV